jgi:hypothetical protein
MIMSSCYKFMFTPTSFKSIEWILLGKYVFLLSSLRIGVSIRKNLHMESEFESDKAMRISEISVYSYPQLENKI